MMHMSAKHHVPGTQLLRICVASFILFFCFSEQTFSADNVDKCLLEALQSAANSVTVGQLREQCQQPNDAVSDGPAEVILKTSRARKPAYFPHRRHQVIYPCSTCHHGKDSSGNLVQYSEGMKIPACTSCHNPDMTNVELNGFKAIGHKLCRECHRTHQDLTSAKCSTCHRKDL